MNKEPLLILCACFILGILFQDYFSMSFKWACILLITCFLTLFLSIAKSFFFQKIKPVFLGIFFFAVGVFSHYLNSKQPELPTVDQKENVVFKLDKKLNSNEKNWRYEVTIFNGKSNFKSVLSVPKSMNELDFAHFYKAELYINRVISPTNDYQFDYQKYLMRKDIIYQSYLPGNFTVAQKPQMDCTDKIRQKRFEILQKINHATLSEHTKEFLKGLILADRTEMDSAVTQDFTKSGLVHFLAISGTHMVVIFLTIMFVLKRIFPTKQRNFGIIISLICIWLFAVFIDYGSSVIRSCLMLSVFYAFVLLQRKPDLLHSMALAGFAILIVDTNQIFDVGFQLSFLAVFGIFWLNEPIQKLFPKPKNKISRLFLGVFSVTLSAQIITLPLILVYFHQFSLISIVANLVIVPVSEIVIVISLLMTVIIGFIGDFPLLNIGYDFLVLWLLKVIHFFAEFNSVYFERIPFSAWEAVLIFGAILILGKLLIKRNLKNALQFSFVLLVFLLVRISLNFIKFNQNEALVHTYFKQKIFSVKDKDKVYFWLNEDSDQQKILKNVISPYLVSRRTNNFEILVLPKNSQSVSFDGNNYSLK